MFDWRVEVSGNPWCSSIVRSNVLIVTSKFGFSELDVHFFNLDQIITEFIHMTVLATRNYNNWRFVRHFMYRQTVYVRLNVFTIVSLVTRKLIVVNLRKSIPSSVLRFDFVTSLIHKASYQQFWNIDLRCIIGTSCSTTLCMKVWTSTVFCGSVRPREFIGVTNRKVREQTHFFSILDFATFM